MASRRRMSNASLKAPSISSDETTLNANDDELTPLINGKAPPIRSIARQEAWALAGLCLPMWCTHVIEYAIGSITIVVLGHVGLSELNAASIAQLLLTTVVISPIIYGLTAALDTLATQAWTSETPKNTSLYVQRTGLLVYLCMAPALIVLFFAERIFLAIHQEPEVARLAGLYIRIYMLGLPLLAAFELCRRWLLAQGLVNVPTYAVIAAAPVCFALNYFLVLGPDSTRLGFVGAPVAAVLTIAMQLVVIVIYIKFFVGREAHDGWSNAMFQDLGPNIKLGLAGILTVSSDWLAWDVISLASSYLGAQAFGANSAGVVISVMLFQLPFAITMSAGIRIGNLLGAQLPEHARIAARVIWASGAIIGVLNSIGLVLARNHLGRIFTQDKDVIRLVAEITPLIAVFQIGDCLTAATQGILRGSALATQGARASIAAYYLAGLPASLLLAFHPKIKMGLKGLWLGFVLALALNAGLNTWFVSRINWKKQARKAQHQNRATEAFMQARRQEEADRLLGGSE